MTHRNTCARARITRIFQETQYGYKCIYFVEWENQDGSKDTETIDVPMVNSQKEMAQLDELEAFLSNWECTTNSDDQRVYENTKWHS